MNLSIETGMFLSELKHPNMRNTLFIKAVMKLKTKTIVQFHYFLILKDYLRNDS